MALDPRNSVSRGQRLAVSADHINYLNRLMRGSTGLSGGPLSPGFAAPYTWVMAKNSTGLAVERWGVMGISGLVVTPTNNATDSATRQFQEMPVLQCGPGPSASASCIAIEPIAPDKIGRVALAGVVQVKAPDVAKVIGGSVLWQDSNWALVLLGGSGAGMKLGKVTAAWNKNSLQDVVVYSEGDALAEATASPADVLPGVVNKFANVAANKWVMVGKANGRWYLISAEC